MSGWQRLRIGLESASHVAVLLGVPFFLFQQIDQQAQRDAENKRLAATERAERAMRFIEMANDEVRTEAGATLSAPFETTNFELFLLTNPSQEELDAAMLKAQRSVRDRDILKISEFYKSVLLCRNAGYCDEKLIDGFFRENITDFYCSYTARLNAIGERLNRRDYADDLKQYAKDCAQAA